MQKNILEHLDQTVCSFPDKIAFEEEHRSITYLQFQESAKKIGNSILGEGIRNGKIAIYLDKSINCLIAMFGALYSGSL